MKDGKISQFIKSHWRTLLFGFALFAGVLCGVWACSQSHPVSVDANRNRIILQVQKIKGK